MNEPTISGKTLRVAYEILKASGCQLHAEAKPPAKRISPLRKSTANEAAVPVVSGQVRPDHPITRR
jgi:hypothetical protein